MKINRYILMTNAGSGVWLANVSQFRLMWRNHDALYIAFWKFRLRIIKSWHPFKTICVLGLVYGWMLASDDEYNRQVKEPDGFQRVIADADARAAKTYRDPEQQQ